MSTGARGLWVGLGVAAAAAVLAISSAISTDHGSDPAVPTMVGGAVEQRLSDLSPAPNAAMPVVKVSVSACGARSHGSGFVMADGLVLTAAHVVGDAGLVRLEIGSNVVTGEVLGRLADGRDLALIAIDTGQLSIPTAGAAPAAGEAVTMVGFPGGQRRTVSVGPRTSPLPTTMRAVVGQLIGVSAPTGEGFSGGPALDAAGRLVGVVVAVEIGTGTSIVVAVPDLESLADAPLEPNGCAPVT